MKISSPSQRSGTKLGMLFLSELTDTFGVQAIPPSRPHNVIGDVVKAPVKSGIVEEVKVLYGVRSSDPLRPQAMH